MSNPTHIKEILPKNVSIEKQPDKQACLSSRAMVSGPRFVLYPSPDGLYMISDEGNRPSVKSLIKRQPTKRKD